MKKKKKTHKADIQRAKNPKSNINERAGNLLVQ